MTLWDEEDASGMIFGDLSECRNKLGILCGTHLRWILLGEVWQGWLFASHNTRGAHLQTFVLKFSDSSFSRFCELPFALRMTLLCRGTDIQMLGGCWAGSLGIRVSHCPGVERGSCWDHLLMDACQLAQPFLWYYYFRDKERPAGFKKYGSQKSSLSSVKCRQLLSICMMWHQIVF